MKAVTKEERRVAYPLVLIFVILSLGIVVGGTFYYRHYERQFRTGIEDQLSAIAELKADELAQYRKERLGDAATFFQNAAFSGLVRRFFDHPEDADAQEQLRTWLDKYQTDHYDRVFLLDTQGVERMSTPVTAAPGSAVVSRLVAEVLQSRKIAFQDFHRNEHNQRIYLTLLVPILDGPDYSRALGVLALRVDTATYLYPFISRWPTPSRTAETLLVRRDGKDVLFLNELKFGTNTALNLRISLENTNVAAVKAVLGQKGVVESIDYRGVPVLAALHAIPDSPWFLIARMDTAEVYAPLRERLWTIILLVSVLVLCVGAGASAIWRHQRVRFYKERSEAAEALRESEERLRSHTDNSPMAVVEWNAGLIITRWTGAAEKMFGWSAEEAIGKPITELPGIYEEDLPIVQSVIQQLAVGVSKHVFSSNRNRTRNGQVIHCEWYNSVLYDAGGKMMSVLSQVLDITERKRAEETIGRERQLLRTSIDLLHETFYVKDLDSRFLVVNETLAKQYGKDSPSQVIGLSDADLYPAGLAAEFRAEEMKVFAGEPIIAHEDSMVFLDGRTHTVLTTKLPFRDSQGRVCGLVGIGQDITERKRAEDELRRTNTFLDSIIENLPNMMFLKDARTLRFVRFNRAGVNLLGCSEADLLGKTDYDFFPKKLADFFTEKDRQVLRGKEIVDIPEEPLQTRDKGERILHTRKVPILNANGEPEYLLGISEDITARKRAEEALRESQALYHSLVEQLPVGVFRKDPAGRYVLVNPGFCRLKGMKAEEFLGKTSDEVAAGTVAKQDRTGRAVKYAAAGGNHHVQIMQTGKPIELVEEYTDASGRKQFVRAMKLPVFNPDGKVIGTQGVLTDITEIKRAEDELRRSNEALARTDRLLQAMLDNIPDWIYFKDTESRILKMGRTLAKAMGMADPEEAVGKTDFDFRDPDQAKEFYEDEQRIIRSGEPLINKTEKQVLANGEIGWTSTTKVPLRDPAGTVIGLVGINRDITQQKLAEEALRLNQERLLKVITQTRCILNSGQVEGPENWRERALEPESPFRWDFPVQNEETAQKIFPLELAPGEKYQQAWSCSRTHDDHIQMNWNSGNAFLNDLPFYRNEFRCIDKHGVGHWMQQFVTVRKLAENRWEIFGITTDISDLKRVETELRESQALYHSLVDQMPAGVFRKDAEGRYIFVNSVFCRIKETTPDQYLGKTALELKVGDVALTTRGAGHHATIMQSGNQIVEDEVYHRADGEIRNYHVVKSPVLDAAGKIVGTQGVLFDITERKRAEQDREQAFQRQQGISWLHENLLASRPLRDKLQLVTETIVRLFDADFCRIWLARPGDLCEQGCMHALATEGPHVCRRREICLHLLASAGRYTHLDGAMHRRVPYGAYKIGRIAAGKETKFLIKNVQQDPQVHDREWAKELGLVSFAGYRLQSPGGVPLGVLALFAKRPLTAQEDVLLEGLSNATTSILLTHLAEDGTRRELAERKRAEEALRWSETQLHVILESTADGLLAVDSKGKVIAANQRFAELWRIPQSLMDAGDDRALLNFVLGQLSEPAAFLKKVQSLYGTDALDMDTLAFKDGRVFERYSFPMMMDEAVIGRVWSFRDITGRKRQEKELSEKNSELERFTYTVSHDLKSPLVTVKTFLGYLEQDLASPDKERVKQDVAYMHTAADKMGQLLDELLNLARVGHKMNPAERVTFKELAQEAVRLVAGRISTGGAEVQVADAAVVLEGDRPRLMEIWQNLVENACKFMGNQPKPRVEIGVEQRGSETVFFVRDNGTGIDPRYQAKVFGLFEKLDPKGEGTGMGLALVKRIVEMYKGRIWVESPGLGQGANFLFTLPGAVIIDPEQSS
jgi:PAS domain S-box-containing protein